MMKVLLRLVPTINAVSLCGISGTRLPLFAGLVCGALVGFAQGSVSVVC